MFDVFISYKHSDDNANLTIDFEYAEKLESMLEASGINVFFSERSLVQHGKSNFKKAIDEALDECQALIVVVSNPEFARSPWVRYEWESFYNDYLSGRRKNANMFTVTIGNVDIQQLPRTLRNLQVFSFENELDKVKTTIGSIFNRDIVSPLQNVVDKDGIYQPFVVPNDFCLMKPEEITPEDIKEVLKMESSVYTESEQQEFELCIQLFRINPRIYLFFKDLKTNQIVGNIDVSPITDECYELIRSGKFRDREITPDMVLSYDMPALYNLYFSGIMIREEYRNTGLFLYMFNKVVKMFKELGEREVFPRRMIADAVTSNGIKFCQLFGMKKVMESAHSSTLYEVSLIPPEFRVTSKPTKELFDYYKEKYQELKDYLL